MVHRVHIKGASKATNKPKSNAKNAVELEYEIANNDECVVTRSGAKLEQQSLAKSETPRGYSITFQSILIQSFLG